MRLTVPPCSYHEETSCLVTGLTLGCDRVSAWLFWLSALAVWWGQKAGGLCVFVQEQVYEMGNRRKHLIECRANTEGAKYEM